MRPSIRPLAGLALVTVLVLAVAPAVSAGPSHAWTRQFGSSSHDNANSVAVDANRNVYVAGRIRTSTDDAYVRKYRPNGVLAWTRQFGSSSGEYTKAIATDRAGNVYVAGTTQGSITGTPLAGGQDGFVRKYRPDGSKAWTRQFGSTMSDQVYGVAVDSAGNVLLAGHTNGALGTASRGGWDIFVRKLRPNGRHAWTYQFGTTTDEFVSDVAVAPDRSIVVTGQTFGSLTGVPSRGARDAFVRKLQPNGTPTWTRQFGTGADDWGHGVAIDGAGKIYIAGETSGALPGQTSRGGRDAFLRKYRPDGSRAWTRQFGATGDDWADGVTTDSAGRIYVAGRMALTSGDALLVKYRPDGSAVWARKTGGPASEQQGTDVAVDHLRHVYLSGYTNGPLQGQVWRGSWDGFLRKYRP